MTESVAELVTSLETIGDRDLDQLRADFTQESVDGTVNPILDDAVVEEAPVDCQEATHDARQRVIDVCLEVNI